MFTQAFIRNPYAAYAEWLERRIFWSADFFGGAWVVPRHADNQMLLRDSDNLTTEKAGSLVAQFPAEYHAELRDLDLYLARWLAFIDPPKHLRIRKLLRGGFTPQVIESFRPRTAAIVNRLLDAVVEQGEMDMVRDFAYQLPVRVVSMMLGVPDADHPRFMRLMDELALFLGNAKTTVAVARGAKNALRELTDYFRELARQRRANPGDDLISILLAAEEEGDVLDAEELYAQCVFFLFAGHETTSNLIGNALYNLLRHPDQMACLRASDDPELVRQMIEETLRFEGPMQYTFRMAKRDFVLFGEEIKRGQVLVLAFGAANRDAAVFPHPDEFDIGRTRRDNPQLTFGYGLHHCIGAGTARMEAEVAFTTLLARLDNIRLLDEMPEWHDAFRFRGLKRLPIAFTKK